MPKHWYHDASAYTSQIDVYTDVFHEVWHEYIDLVTWGIGAAEYETVLREMGVL